MERCVLCWRETDIPKDTPVSRRKYYLEGQGQLCAKCYYELYGAGVFRHTQGAEKLLAEWDTEKNAPLTPDDIHKGSHKKVWWRCATGMSGRRPYSPVPAVRNAVVRSVRENSASALLTGTLLSCDNFRAKIIKSPAETTMP